MTVPNDARLPNAGQQRCGFYDIKQELFGQYTLRVTNAKEFVGKYGNTRLPQRYWDGFTVGLNGRLPYDARLGGGIDVGRNVDDHCFTVDVPNQPMDITGSDGLNTGWNTPVLNSQGEGACRAVTSWANNLDFRINGNVPIKGGFNASFIFRNTVGANASQGVTLLTPNSLFGDRFNQLDLSVNKMLDIGWGRLRLAFDLYNALNGSSIQNVTTAYTTTANANRWTRPTTFLDPRLARITMGLQF
jgi:hypothetical protein